MGRSSIVLKHYYSPHYHYIIPHYHYTIIHHYSPQGARKNNVGYGFVMFSIMLRLTTPNQTITLKCWLSILCLMNTGSSENIIS